uniref:Cytochrome P450 2U1 n=1 Tax=Ciona savignyi TaxID=51511 RepID=H2Z9F5_CIOSA
RRPKNFPPGPSRYPILGVLPFLGNYPERKMRKWSKQYGPVMSVRMGRQDWVVLGDYETIQQGLVKHGNAFSGRPSIATIDQITEGHGVLFIDYNDHWKRQRRFGLSTLRGFGVGKRSMEDRITEEVAYLNDAIRTHDGKAFDIQSILSNAVSNNICSIVMGRRFDYDDERFKEIMGRLARGYITLLSVCFAGAVNHFNGIFSNKRTLFPELLREIVEEHKASYEQDNHRDFIDAFLGEQKAENGAKTFTDTQLLQYVRDLFVAGTETTTSTVRWSLLCLIHNPETQEKLRKEIFEVLGPEKIPAFENKSKMPYTSAFIQEIYRYRTLVPLSVTHMTNEDAHISGYTIPKGTTIAPNLWAVHNDPEEWDEPNKFKPERHLDAGGNFVQLKHVIPFSVGPRHCLGEQLARMEVFIFLVSLVQKFEFLPDPKATVLPDIENGASGAAYVPLPFKIVAKVV